MPVRNSQKQRIHPRKIRSQKTVKTNTENSEEDVPDFSKELTWVGGIVFVLIVGFLIYRYYG